MFTEKNIPRLIFIIPFIGILLSTILFTSLIINNKYSSLKQETEEIRKNYILNEKLILKRKIDEVLNFIKYSKLKGNKTFLQGNTLNYIENIISKNNGYIYVIDEKANIVSHPVLKTNTNVLDLKDKNGFSIAKNIIKLGKEYPDGNYLSYYWKETGELVEKEKTVFIYHFKEWDWFIVIGKYMDVVEKQIITNIKYQKYILFENIKYTLFISFILTFFILIFSYFFSKKVNTLFLNYKKDVSKKEDELKILNEDLKKKADYEKIKRNKREKELEVAYKDMNTGLPNREKLLQVLKHTNSPKLAIFNIDRFIDINHYYSPHVADILLGRIAKLLTRLFNGRKEISVYKLPVDKYAIYSNSNKITKDDFINICKKAINEIEKKPFLLNSNSIIVSITCGVSLTSDNVIINADTALKIAKNKHKTLLVYNKEDNIEVSFQNNVKWTQILKNAILEDRIVVFIQPIINNMEKSNEKYECLIRIKEKDGKIISPYQFLELSKGLKLYHQLTRIVIEKSFEYFTNSTAEFSINLTLDDIINKETIQFIKSKLSNENIAKRVIFEIVESEGIDNFEEVSLFIKEMKSLGCKIAIDDFGTGYSNFEYLMELNVDYIKIDGSFIKNIDTSKNSLIIAELIISFAKKQNIKTVAEFVHSKSVLQKVNNLGINYSQGYYLGEPREIK